MELYYRDLISEEASLEKLVDDLMLVVQGAHELATAAGAQLPEEERAEIATRLARLKASCRRIKDQAVAGARAADLAVREHPYWAVGLAFATGLLVGLVLRRRD